MSRLSTSARVCLALATALGVALCATPLFAIQGLESALALGIFLPPMAAWCGACVVRDTRADPLATTAGQLLARAVTQAIALWAAPSLVLFCDALRVRNCTPLLGLSFMLLGPAIGVVLASVCGVGIALCLRSARRAAVFALLLPIATMLSAVYRFYATPAIFAYGHFFGFFPGTLYDENIAITEALLRLRVLSLTWIAGLSLWVIACLDPHRLRITLLPRDERRGSFVLACLLIALGLTGEVFAVALGNESSTARLREVLAGKVESARCELIFPRELPRSQRRRLADECDFRVEQAEHWLGVTHPARIHVYLFRSPDEKAALMGAADTNIAKPWRSEVYLSDLSWPNPTLGHELVHIVARGTGAGPLRVAARAAGLWPDPALIEGVAVAAAWQTQSGLTPHQWARAMLELKMLPPLRALFGASFLAQERRLAYTVSGSLLRYVAQTSGSSVVRKAYATDDLAGAVGSSLDELDGRYRAYLATIPLPQSALALARSRFSGSSIFSEVCPHALAALKNDLSSDLAAGDDASARKECLQILDVDGADSGTRAALVAIASRQGDMTTAARELAALLGPPAAPVAFITLARQAQADEDFRHGRYAQALATYNALLSEPNDDDVLRILQVKRLALSSTPEQRQLIFDLLVGAPGEHADGATALYLARELRALRDDGLSPYLEGRQLYNQRRYSLAAPLLARANRIGLPSDQLRIESLRIEGTARFAIGDLDTASTLFHALGEDNLGRSAEADDWQARIAFARKQHLTR